MNYLVSNLDLEDVLGSKCWCLYSDLNNMTSIDKLLPKQTDYKIILIKENPIDAHWICICKRNNIYYYFDSYGKPIDYTFNYVKDRNKLNEPKNKLTELLQNKNVIINKIDYQGKKASDCGRWCLLFVIMFKMYKYNINEFNDFMKTLKTETKLSYDNIVVELTKTIIGN